MFQKEKKISSLKFLLRYAFFLHLTSKDTVLVGSEGGGWMEEADFKM